MTRTAVTPNSLMARIALGLSTATIFFLLLNNDVKFFDNGGAKDVVMKYPVTPSPPAAMSTPRKEARRRLDGRAKPAIVTMVANDNESIEDLCLMMKSLLFLKGGYGGSFIRGGPAGIYTSAPVLVFNEGDLTDRQMQGLKSCTSRPVAFPVVKLDTYPANFDEEKEWKAFSQWTNFRPMEGRRDWSYAQMLRFFTSGIFRHPAVQQYDLLMKVDSDACFMRQRYIHMNPFYQEAPGLEGRYVYQTNYDGGMTGNPQFVENLYDTAVAYMKKENLQPKNPKLWAVVKAVWEETGNMPVFLTQFEILRRNFFQREEVAKWLDHLTDKEPFGVFRYRWSDSTTRVLTMAMFADEQNLLLSKSTGFLHGRGRCAKNFIADVHDRLKTEERW